VAQNDQIDQILRRGIDAAKAGDTATARTLLERVIQLDENNELAWIWMASCVATVRERRICLERVLQLNPNNARARQALNALVGVSGARSMDSADIARDATTGSRLPFNPNSPMARIGLVVLMLFTLVVICPRLGAPPPPVTPRIKPTQEQTPRATFTPSATATFPGVRVTRDPTAAALALPPTFTPTPSETPTPSPTATATPFPLGEFTLYVAARGEGELQPSLYRYAGDGSGELNLLPDARNLAIDVVGEQIAFVRDVTYPADAAAGTPETTVGELFLAPLSDVTQARQITRLQSASVRNPVFNPKGRDIIFVSDYDGDDELYLIDPVTGTTTQITRNTIADKTPSWSPDGKLVAFVSTRAISGLPDIYVLDISAPPPATAETENSDYPADVLLDLPGSSFAPMWSPDGTQLAFLNDEEGDADVYITNTRGTRTTLVTPDDGAEDRAPNWTPDGRAVVFVSNAEDGRFQVYMADLAERTVTRLVHSDREVESAVFRPDIRFRLN
jgi:hypothetical protein